MNHRNKGGEYLKKLKIMLLTIIVIIIIAIILILIIINMNRHKILSKEEKENQDIENNSGYLLLGQKPEKVELRNIYFSVQSCLEKVINFSNENDKASLYKVFNKEYIKEKGIKQENAIELTSLNDISKYKIKDMYQITGSNYSSYYLKVIDQDYKEMYFNINWDSRNEAFDFKILNKNDYEKYIETTIDNANSEEESIAINDANSIPYKYLTDDDFAEKYFFDYIENAIDFPEEAYNSLNEEYKREKFGSLDRYKIYLNNDKEIFNMYKAHNVDSAEYNNYLEYLTSVEEVGLEKYTVQEKGSYTQIICIDSYNNYYIFKVYSLMKYEVILDTYTIEIPEFVQKYDSSNEREKVILNINKFIQSINDKDYKYAYSVLADSFKQNKFKTEIEFEEYIKANFFEKNEISFEKFGSQAETYYTYSVKMKDKQGIKNKIIEKTFIVLLEEERNFKLSFNV